MADTRFKSPVYSELAIWLVFKTGDTPARLRAHNGYFDVPDKALKAFRKWAKDRPQYRIEEVGPEAEPEGEPEVEPVHAPEDEAAEEAAIAAADDEADDEEDDLDAGDDED